MTSNAGPSPVWLGVIAILSFGGLVIASFASGYHLVGSADPRVAIVPATSAPASPSAAQNAKPARSAVVRQGLDAKRAVLRSQPGGGEVVDQLAAEQRVRILTEKGAWLQVSYERGGKTRQGWAEAINLTLAED